jgi:hypothetical protein
VSEAFFRIALHLSGRRLSRESVVGVLERLRNFQTGVLAPLNYGTNRRASVVPGAVVMRLDPERSELIPEAAG